ncbi:hypothetical protein F5ESL0259_00105 [Lactobacillus sp. ESL0259]|nr:hypothetical protein F5ESL0259_00105 [Lactobacillus sp. ESL0259]
MKTKNNYENVITYFLTNSKKSYTQLAQDIEHALKFMTPIDVTTKRVKDWAHSALSYGPELKAISLITYGNQDK